MSSGINDYRVSRDTFDIKFSKVLLNPDKHYLVFCLKCGEEIRNRYNMNGKTCARCISCNIYYYISKDCNRSKKLEVEYEH